MEEVKLSFISLISSLLSFNLFNSFNSSVNCNTDFSCALTSARSPTPIFPIEKLKSFDILTLLSFLLFSICSNKPLIFKFKVKFSACCFDNVSFNFLISVFFKSNFFCVLCKSISNADIISCNLDISFLFSSYSFLIIAFCSYKSDITFSFSLKMTSLISSLALSFVKIFIVF